MKITSKIENNHNCLDSEQRTHKADAPDKDRYYNLSPEKTDTEFNTELEQGHFANRLAAIEERDRLRLDVPSRRVQKDMEIEEDEREELKRKGKAPSVTETDQHRLSGRDRQRLNDPERMEEQGLREQKEEDVKGIERELFRRGQSRHVVEFEEGQRAVVEALERKSAVEEFLESREKW